MSKDPAFLFYSSDFISGVSDLTMEERGQYITLLCLQHQKGHLTKKAISISCPSITEDVLSKFKIDENGMYYNGRLEFERDKRAQHSEKQRQRAVDGWKKRKDRQSHSEATADATALPLEDANENEDIIIDEIDNSNKPKKKKQVKAIQEFKIDNDKKEIFEYWLEYRKEIKKSIKSKSTIENLVKLFNSEPIGKVKWVVGQSISNEWQGLFWDKYDPKTKQNQVDTVETIYYKTSNDQIIRSCKDRETFETLKKNQAGGGYYMTEVAKPKNR